MALALVVGSLTGPAQAAPSAAELAELRKGHFALRMGRPRVAAEHFRAALDRDPELVAARQGLGRSLAAVGACTAALPALQSVRDTPRWSWRDALAEGDCEARTGRLAHGRAAWEEADALGAPEGTVAFRELTAAVRHGDRPGFFAARRALEAAMARVDDERAERLANQLALGDAWWAWRGGDVEGAGRDLAERARRNPTRGLTAQAYAYEGLSALDRDDPGAAERALAEAVTWMPTDPRLHAWRAEALRRLGSVDEAAAVVERPVVRTSALPSVLAVRARVLVDEGRRDEAEAVLARIEDAQHPERLATAWYLARYGGPVADGQELGAGEVAATDALASAWRRVQRRDRQRLDHLVPLDRREEP